MFSRASAFSHIRLRADSSNETVLFALFLFITAGLGIFIIWALLNSDSSAPHLTDNRLACWLLAWRQQC